MLTYGTIRVLVVSRIRLKEEVIHVNLNLQNMTTAEKLRTMEMLWDDICRNIPEFPSPAWHEQLLQEREHAVQEGKDRFIDWEQAKHEIWESVS